MDGTVNHFPVKNALDILQDVTDTISNIFRDPRRALRRLDPDTNFRLARQASLLIPFYETTSC